MRARCGAFRYFPDPLDDGTKLKGEGKILHYVQNDGNSREDSSLTLRMTVVRGVPKDDGKILRLHFVALRMTVFCEYSAAGQ